MKTDILKKFIKEAVKEAIHEELKDILLEAVKHNKQSITESDTRTLNFTTNSIPHRSAVPTNTRQAYMDILNDMVQGPKSEFEGEFKVTGPINTVGEGSALPQGQLGLDQIMNLIKK